jgi:uncharacterized NAD(P)/FAD-binding protein YdhS
MRRILIVGGGATGLIVATNLLRKSTKPTQISIADPRESIGLGVAYSTADTGHVLNVPASRMSMFVDDSEHFMTWAGKDKNYFAPRKEYAQYLSATWRDAESESEVANTEHIRMRVVDIQRETDSWLASFSDGSSRSFDVAVLAIGHGEAFTLNSHISSSSKYIADAWREALPFTQGVLLGIGTGLTFVDHALSHLRRSDSNTVIGISRNGLLPESHLSHRAEPLAVTAESRISPTSVRRFIESAPDWRAAQDGIRHELPEIWQSWSDDQKNQFLTQDLRWWNVHRHRLAPEVAQEIEIAIHNGRLRIIATELLSLKDSANGTSAHLANGDSVEVDVVLNCLGYRTPGDESLLGALFKSGVAARGPLNLGLRTNFPDFNVLAEDGTIHKNLYALGPLLFGERFETTAIPEIRVQAASVASSIVD